MNNLCPCKEYKFSQTKVSQTHCTVMTSSSQKSIIPHYFRHGPASYWWLKFRSMWMGSHRNSPVRKNVLAHHGASAVANLPSPCSSEHTVFPGTSIFPYSRMSNNCLPAWVQQIHCEHWAHSISFFPFKERWKLSFKMEGTPHYMPKKTFYRKYATK